MKIIVASSNKGKIKEIKEFFEGCDIIPYSEVIEPFEIVEDGDTFKENAIIKAKAIYEKIPGSVILADDSGITVPALGGVPGIYSARYAGVNATDKDNLYKLIDELKANGLEKTSAFYTAAIAIATPYGIFTTHGFMRGDVIAEARGDKGFGYDPMFIPKGFDKTLGELDDSVKKHISHRSRALELAKVIIGVV